MECTTKTPAEHTRELYDTAAKRASRKICGKMIARTGPFKTAETHAAIYNAFDQNPEDKKLPYDDFLKAYGLHAGHISRNAFDEYKRVHSFAEGIVDASRRQALRDVSVTVAAKLASVRDAVYGLDSGYPECAGFSNEVSAAVETLLNDIAKGENILTREMAKSTQEISTLYENAIAAKKREAAAIKKGVPEPDFTAQNDPYFVSSEEADEMAKMTEREFDKQCQNKQNS